MAPRLRRLAFLLIMVSQIAATCRGTETGNPQQNDGEGSGCPTVRVSALTKAAAGSDESVDDLIAAICQRAIACGVATTTDTCVNALNGADGDLMTDEFGRPEGTTIVQLRSGLVLGTVDVDVSAQAVCETDIGDISCDTVTVNLSDDDFSKAETIIPDSCLDVFPEPDATTEEPSSGPPCS